MTTYNFTVNSQFLISGTDASGTFTNKSYPTMSGLVGDTFRFLFLQSDTYAFSIENTDFENKYDTSAYQTGTYDSFVPSGAATYLYYNPVDFETYGDIIVGAVAATTTTTTTAGPGTTTTTTTTLAPVVYNVTVAQADGSNKYFINGSQGGTITFEAGKTYRFDQSDMSNINHPLRFSTISNGTHAGGSVYTSGVVISGVPGQAGSYSQITIPSG
jgi:hypothetical protein